MTLKVQKKGLTFCFILLNALLLQINQVNTRTNDNPPREEFNALGLTVKVYFDPEPGVLLLGVSKIKGIIRSTGIFTGLYLHVEVRSYGSFRGEDTSMLELGGPDYFIFQENQTHKKEITIRVLQEIEDQELPQVRWNFRKKGISQEEIECTMMVHIEKLLHY